MHQQFFIKATTTMIGLVMVLFGFAAQVVHAEVICGTSGGAPSICYRDCPGGDVDCLAGNDRDSILDLASGEQVNVLYTNRADKKGFCALDGNSGCQEYLDETEFSKTESFNSAGFARENALGNFDERNRIMSDYVDISYQEKCKYINLGKCQEILDTISDDQRQKRSARCQAEISSSGSATGKYCLFINEEEVEVDPNQQCPTIMGSFGNSAMIGSKVLRYCADTAEKCNTNYEQERLKKNNVLGENTCSVQKKCGTWDSFCYEYQAGATGKDCFLFETDDWGNQAQEAKAKCEAAAIRYEGFASKRDICDLKPNISFSALAAEGGYNNETMLAVAWEENPAYDPDFYFDIYAGLMGAAVAESLGQKILWFDYDPNRSFIDNMKSAATQNVAGWCYDPRGKRLLSQEQLDLAQKSLEAQRAREQEIRQAVMERQQRAIRAGQEAAKAKINFGGVGGLVPSCQGETCGWQEFIQLVNNVIEFLIIIGTFVVLAAFVYAGWLLTTSGGDPGKRGQAKTLLFNVIGGFIFILLSWLIVATLMTTLGVDEKINKKAPGLNLLEGEAEAFDATNIVR